MTNLKFNSSTETPAAQTSEPCIFCDIVLGKSPSHKVWESDTHLAFLSIYPNTKGVTVVIPKEHFTSYAFEMPEEKFLSLMSATKEVAYLLDKKLNVNRTALVLEGFGVNHVHAKLFPMHGVPTSSEWKAIESSEEKKKEYFDCYQGYISSHDGRREDDQKLSALSGQLFPQQMK